MGKNEQSILVYLDNALKALKIVHAKEPNNEYFEVAIRRITKAIKCVKGGIENGSKNP